MARDARCSCPSRALTTRSTPPPRSRPAASPAPTRHGRPRRSPTSHGAGRRFELLGESAAGARVYDDYAHHPTEVAATIAAARTLAPQRVVAVFQPHLYSRTRALARDFGRALAQADLVVALDVYRARERPEDFPGVDGKLIADAAADAAAGRTVAWLPALEDAERFLRAQLRAGDVCLAMGAGDVDELGREARRAMSQLPPGVQPDYPLARLTTVRTGGDGQFFARPATVEQLVALLTWAREHGYEVGVVGSGSNLLVADAGVRGLVMKLDKDLAQIERHGTRLACGGGARLPSVSARAANAGLTGIEFGVNIPGTVGGAVRMNANAYGGELARVLEHVDVATAGGRRAPHARRARLRLPPLEPRRRRDRRARVVPAGARGRRAGEGDARGDARASARRRSRPASRRSARPSEIPTTRAPRAAPPVSCSTLPAAAGCASAAPASRRSTRTSSRTTAARAPPTCSR